MLNRAFDNDTICAIATPHGMGAIAVIRISGSNAFTVVTSVFQRNGKTMPIEDIVSHKAFYGHIIYKGEMLDEVLVRFSKAPTLSRVKTRPKSVFMAQCMCSNASFRC